MDQLAMVEPRLAGALCWANVRSLQHPSRIVTRVDDTGGSGTCERTSEQTARLGSAHTPNGRGERHRLEDHLWAVGEPAAKYAGGLGMDELARWAGRWHDIGKGVGCLPAISGGGA